MGFPTDLHDVATILWPIVTILMILAGVVGPIFAFVLFAVAASLDLPRTLSYFLYVVAFGLLTFMMIKTFELQTVDRAAYLLMAGLISALGLIMTIILSMGFLRAYNEEVTGKT